MDNVNEYIQEAFAVTYDNNPYMLPLDGLFRHFITIDISGTDFEVPVIAKDCVVRLKNAGYTEIVIPLADNELPDPKKSVKTILSWFTGANIMNLRKAIVRGNEIYRGCLGLILDEESNPLFMLTVRMHYHAENRTAEVTKCICRIPSNIMERQEQLIPKTIYKKVIPLLATSPIEYVYVNSVLQDGMTNKKPDIIMSTDCNIVFHNVAPRPADATNEVFNQIIREEIERWP